MRLFYFLVLMVTLLGCASTSLNESYGTSNLTQNNVEKIKIGVTAKAEILSLFGQPFSKTKNSQMEMWTYTHTKSKTTSPPFFSMQDFKVEVQSSSLIISFDDQDVVKDITSTEINPVQPASVSITENK